MLDSGVSPAVAPSAAGFVVFGGWRGSVAAVDDFAPVLAEVAGGTLIAVGLGMWLGLWACVLGVGVLLVVLGYVLSDQESDGS